MSLCRWSSMSYKCDLYIYETNTGWSVHVAGNRVKGHPPKEDWNDIVTGNLDKFMDDQKKLMEFMETAEREPIGGPHDGESFHVSLEELKPLVLHLRECGYQFPDYVLESIDEEMKDD